MADATQMRKQEVGLMFPKNGHAVSRRSFLKKTAGAASAAALFPYLVPGSALGAEGTPPSERLTMAFIGLGKQMGGHISAFLNRDSCQVVALCDVESIRLDRKKAEVEKFYADRNGQGAYPGCAVYKDFREIAARDDIDAVVIATPDHWHALTSLAMMASGKDVYCEKPLTLTIAEGKLMRQTARMYGRVFQTGSQQRSDREFRIACELVRNGRIGKVHTVNVNVGGPSVECHLPGEPVPDGLDWDFWLGPAPWRPYNAIIAPHIDVPGYPNFRLYRDYSGGGMTDWGAHHFDIAQWGLGMDGSGPVEIIPPNGRDVDRLTYKYANGVVMHHGGGAEGAGVEFIGDAGRVMVNRGYLKTDPAGLELEPLGSADVRLYESPGHHDDWLRCIATRSKPICDVAIGHSSASVCHLGNIAYWIKRPLRWDPDREVFLRWDNPAELDAEANRLLQRPMRSPWKLA